MSDKAAWIPAEKTPSKDDWVVVSACGMVRCVAWNNAVKQWQDWGNTGIILDKIEWWMPIPDTPEKPKSKADDGSAAAEIDRLRGHVKMLREAIMSDTVPHSKRCRDSHGDECFCQVKRISDALEATR